MKTTLKKIQINRFMIDTYLCESILFSRLGIRFLLKLTSTYPCPH